MMKRANGSGSITPLRNGRFWARISHPPSAEHPWGRRESLGTFADPAEADSVLRGALDLLSSGAVAPAADGPSLLGFELRYFELRALRGRDKKAKRERARYRLHLRAAPFAAWPMSKVTTLDAQRWIDLLASQCPLVRAASEDSRLSRETIKKIIGLARSVFRYAVKDGICAENPFKADLELPAEDEREEELWGFLRPAEQAALLTCVEIPEVVRVWLAFAMGTGMRIGELHRLQLVDVDADGSAPCVRVRKTKTNRPRSIPLFGLALRAWRRWLELLPSYCPKNVRGLAFPRPRGGMRTGLGLPRPNGAGGQQQHEHEVWRGYLRAAGITRDLRPYDATRHTCATSLLCGFWGPRWQLVDVGRVLGHTSTKTTERYAHVADEVLRDAGAATTAAELAELLAPVGYAVGYGDAKNPARPARFERATNGLEGRVQAHEIQGLTGANDQQGTNPDAVEILRALARGDAQTARAGGRELAERVMGSRLVRLARQVLEGGPFIDARIVELCGAVLDQEDEAAGPARRTG